MTHCTGSRASSPVVVRARVAGVQPLHGGAQQALQLPRELHQIQELLALGVKGLHVFGAGEQEARCNLPVELGLGDGDDLHVGEVAAEYPRGHFQLLQHVRQQQPVAGPAAASKAV